MQANLLLYSHLADIELIHKVKAGRTECFETLVRRHNKTLFRIGRAFGLSDSAVEDLIAGLYGEVYPYLQSYDLRNSYRCWLTGRMVAVCSHLPADESDGLADEGEVLTLAPAATGNLLEQRLAALPVAQRVALILCEIEGFSEKEAAEMMGKSKTAVDAELRQARQQVGDQLMGWYFGTDVYNCPAACSDAITERTMSLIG